MSEDAISEGGAEPEGSLAQLLKSDFLTALRADFAVHGADVIAATRADDPLQYIKLIAALLPKDAAPPPRDAFEHLSDAELMARIGFLETAIKAAPAAGTLPAFYGKD